VSFYLHAAASRIAEFAGGVREGVSGEGEWMGSSSLQEVPAFNLAAHEAEVVL